MNLYIHFPYCLYKCHYCDFNSFATSPEKVPSREYVRALLREIELRNKIFEETGTNSFPRHTEVRTVFLGGGTPSLLPPSALESLLNGLSNFFQLTRDTEITIEANPKTLTTGKLSGYRNAGVNRISVGIQSLSDRFLKPFGRIHSADEALEAIRMVSQAPFRSWNADLIFGFPGQTVGEWFDDLSTVLGLNPPHLSCYGLTVEEGTPYRSKIAEGKLNPPDEETQSEMFQKTSLFLENGGLMPYEISNFARSGHECAHNLNYWQYGACLGLGAGAVSFFHQTGAPSFGYRTTNIKDPSSYIRSVQEQSPDLFSREDIPVSTAMGEFVMMGLRLNRGLDRKKFEILFGTSLTEAFGPTLADHRERGLMAIDQDSLTEQGRLFSNDVMADFVTSP